MKISTLFYTIKQGFANIFRNKWYSLASIATISACLFLFGLFYCIVANFQNILKTAEEGVSVTVFFHSDMDNCESHVDGQIPSEQRLEEIGQEIAKRAHKKNENYFKVLEMHHPDMVIHCGDAEGSEYALSSAAECPVYIVLGNNDFFSDLPREITLDIGSYKVWVTHGHNYYVSMGNETIKKEAIDRGVDIVLYGHTHRPVIDIDDDIIAVNPGSLSYPRQEGRQPSYAIMEIDRRGKVHFTIAYLRQ